MTRAEELVYSHRKERFEERRKEGQDRKLADEFFDHPTLLAISRLISQGQFETIDYPISTGKEGGVFRASGPSGYRAVKVYRIGNTIFRHLPRHVLVELRRETSERNRAGVVVAWTRREHTILRRMKEAQVRVPQPHGYLRNVLVMEFLGAEGLPSPKLKDAVVADPSRLREELIEQIRRMVQDARLVHGDLSEYNVLYHESKPVLIDVAQSVEADHPQARELLIRDGTHFAEYLTRLGAPVTAQALLKRVGVDSVGNRKGRE